MAFKSNDRTFEKIYGAFDKRDYFNSQGLAKVQIGNFERALKKNDKGAQQILDKFKGDMGKAKDYITQVITDRKKEDAFNQYKAFKVAVDSIQKGKPQYGAVDLVKSRIHNSSQKYTIALYSALRNKKFTKWKDVHNDVDDLIGEGFSSDAQRKAAFANGYEEKGKKKNESVNEAAITYGIEYKSSKNDRKFKKASLTKTTHNPNIDKMMIKAISKDAKSLAKQDGWVDYRITKDGVPVKESVNEAKAFVVMYKVKKDLPNRNVKPSSAAYSKEADAKKFLKSIEKDGGKGMIVKSNVRGMKESVNEASKLAMGIAGFTGTRGDAVDDFINTHNIDAKKLFNFVKNGNLKDRISFVSAIAGRPNNKMFKMITKQFSESINERYSGNSKDFKYDLENALDKIGISYKAIKKISKKGKGFEVRMSSYMKNRDTWEKLGKEIGAELVDFKPGSINIGLYEGKKRYNQKDGVGKSKYVISYHDGKKKHKDGSDFFDIQIFKNKKDLAKFVNALHKGGYVYGFNESEDGVPQGYNPTVENKKEVEQIAKKTKSETAFYDVLSKIEKKYGKRNYRLWLEKSLKDLGVNAKHYDYRTNAAAEEKLYQLTK